MPVQVSYNSFCNFSQNMRWEIWVCSTDNQNKSNISKYSKITIVMEIVHFKNSSILKYNILYIRFNYKI